MAPRCCWRLEAPLGALLLLPLPPLPPLLPNKASGSVMEVECVITSLSRGVSLPILWMSPKKHSRVCLVVC